MNTTQQNKIIETVPNKIMGYTASILVANGGGGIQATGKTIEEALMNIWNRLSFNITTYSYACPHKSLSVINESGDSIWWEVFDMYPKTRPVGCGMIWNGGVYSFSPPCFLAIPMGQKFAEFEVSKVMNKCPERTPEVEKTISNLPKSSFLWVKETDCWVPVDKIEPKQWGFS